MWYLHYTIDRRNTLCYIFVVVIGAVGTQMRIRVLLISLAICTILVGACATAEVEDEVVPAEEEAVGEEEEVIRR